MASKESCVPRGSAGGQGLSPNPCWHFIGTETPQGSAQDRGTHALELGQQQARQKDRVLVWQCWRQGIRPRQVFNWNGIEITGGQNSTLLWCKERGWGIREESPASFYDNCHSKSLHCNLT